jgi:4-carboxymuconolactone decarboxylase
MMKKIADFDPKIIELNNQVLFGDIWERPGLSKRDRSLITVAALVALYRTNELPSHLLRARENGVSFDELAEVFTHLAFYAGWPNALTAIRTAIEYWMKPTRRRRCLWYRQMFSLPSGASTKSRSP